MGRKQAGKGKCVLLYTACSLALVAGIWGCANFRPNWKRGGRPAWAQTSLAKGERHLARARTLLAKGKYEASEGKTKEVLRLYPRTLGDEALIQMGLIYVYPDNPDRDYQKSLGCFQRLIKEFPQSKAKGQAEVWVLLLQEAMDKDIIFQQEIANKDKWIGELKKETGDLETVLKKKKKRIKEMESEAKRLETKEEGLVAEAEKLKEQLLRLKEIDLGIEEKKSEAGQAE